MTSNDARIGTVTGTNPYQVQLLGESAPLNIAPIVLSTVNTGDYVWCEFFGQQLVVMGRIPSPARSVTREYRRVGENFRTASLSYSTSDQNVNTVTLPSAVCQAGQTFSITYCGNCVNDTAGNYTDMQVKIGASASVGGSMIDGTYVDHRIAGRVVGYSMTTEYVYGTNGEANGASTMNVVVVCHPNANNSLVSAAANRPASLFVDLVV